MSGRWRTNRSGGERNEVLGVKQMSRLTEALARMGHPGGAEETEAVERFLESLSNATFVVREYRGERDSATAPRLFVVHKSIATG
jgi:hypothetical protein